MPELPEVETVARQLRAAVKNKTLKSISILDLRIDNENKLKKNRNKKILDVYRFGKEVIFELDNCFISTHLRMTGRLLELGKQAGKIYYHDYDFNPKHIRLTFNFSDKKIAFVDTRRFGTVKVLNELKANGLDPTKKEFSLEAFISLVNSTTQSLKNFLMRQDKITGIGNIYASEILFDSKLSPLRNTNTLKEKDLKILHRSIIKILNKAIENCGTTFSDFQTTTGEVGNYQRFLKVYARENQKCRKCKKEIIRIVQQQRSTFYCKQCQK